MDTFPTPHRPTSSTKRHRALSAAAAAGLVSTLLAANLGSASAMPALGDPPYVRAPSRSDRIPHSREASQRHSDICNRPASGPGATDEDRQIHTGPPSQ